MKLLHEKQVLIIPFPRWRNWAPPHPPRMKWFFSKISECSWKTWGQSPNLSIPDTRPIPTPHPALSLSTSFSIKAWLSTSSSPVLAAQPHAPHHMSGADMLHCGSDRMTFASQRSEDSKVPGSPSAPTSGALSSFWAATTGAIWTLPQVPATACWLSSTAQSLLWSSHVS